MPYNERSSAQGMTYTIRSTKLSQEFIDSEIKNCLDSLYNTNEMVFDYWLSELFDDCEMKISENWNEANLQEMYKDVDTNRLNQISDVMIDEVILSFAG